MKNITLLIAGFMLMVASAALGQSSKFEDYIKNYSPLSPNSASLGKYGDIPVSLYTGVPDIRIPLYEIDVRGFKLPISLSYHAGGIKVEEVASWVGLGWSLNAGGVINRIQRGVNDEFMLKKIADYYGSDVQTIMTDPNSSASQALYSNFFHDPFDLDLDQYNYNFAGHSGKIFSDLTGKFYAMPANKLTFSADQPITYNGTDEIFYGRWIVKDNEGITYVFGKSTTDVSYNNAAIEIINNLDYDDGDPAGAGDPNYLGDMAGKSVNSWYLREIILPSGEKIEFTYEAYSYTVTNTVTQTYHERLGRVVEDHQSATRYRKALRLQQILFPNGKVVFSKSQVRRPDLNKDYALDKIEIFEKAGANYTLLRYFKFQTNNPATVAQGNDDQSFRLMLESVTEYDKNNAAKPPYLFQYISGLPPRDSKAQDLWGYYNGVTQNTTLIPVYTDESLILDGALRNVNPATIANGTLTRITYPTGGYTAFSYENNRARVISPEARELLTTTLKGSSVIYHNAAVLNGTETESFSQPFTISNPNATYTPLKVAYTFMDETRYDLYTQDLAQNGFINVTLQKETTPGTFTEFPSGFPVTADGQSFSQADDGTYRIRLAWTTGVESTAFAQFSLSWELFVDVQDVDSNTVVDVGGLRVKEISHHSGVTGQVKTTRYDYDLNGASSGLIRNVPVYFYRKNESEVIGTQLVSFTNVLNRSSVSQSPLLTAQGSTTGYQKVTVTEREHEGTGINGSTEHLFTTALDYPDVNLAQSFAYPFPAPVSYEWCHGLEKEILYNKYEGGQFRPVKKETFTYSNFFDAGLPDFKIQTGVKIYLYAYNYGGSEGNWDPTPTLTGNGFAYQLFNGMPFLQSRSITEYDDAGSPALTQATSYTLSDNALLNDTETTTDSRGETLTTYYRYAADLYHANASGTDAIAIKNLIADHNKGSLPVEKYVVRTNASSQSFVVAGTLYKYDLNVPLPSEVYSLEITEPVPLNSFSPASINGSYQLAADSRYKLLVNYHYDQATHNLVRQTRAAGAPASMLWGYNHSFPVATASNALESEIYVQDFESGSFTPGAAHTGRYYGPGNYTVNFTIPNARPYVISYWYLDGSSWKFSGELAYTGPSMQLSVGAPVDDVRISPKDAHLVTYTYDPLTGLTSTTDAKGLTQYYNYDNYGRLEVIRNSRGEILKKFDYHYQGQPLN